MQNILAQLIYLVLPAGATSGRRIVIDGIAGLIQVYSSTNELVAEMGDETFPYRAIFGDYETLIEGDRIIFFNNATSAEAEYGVDFMFMRSPNGNFFPGFSSDGDAGEYLVVRGTLRARDPNTFNVETWHNLPLGGAGGWLVGIQPQYRLYPDGDVALRGRVTGGSTVVGTVIGTLPVGYRIPAAYAGIRFVCGRSDATAQYGEIQLQANGDLVVAAPPTLASLDLSGIRFSTLT